MSVKEMITSCMDDAMKEMLDVAAAAGIDTCFDRYVAQQPQCGFGSAGLCCRICGMGPCRIDPFGNGPKKGICGADADNICARALARMMAGGASAHSDHGRGIAHTLYMAATMDNCDYKITDETKCLALATELGIATEGREIKAVAKDIAEMMLGQFGQFHGLADCFMKTRAPEQRYKIWEENGVIPRAFDREVVEMMHRTHIGVDSDYVSILTQGIRCSLADGWLGSMLATECSDILFGTPTVIETENNMGVLKKDYVNLALHGHEPTLSCMIVEASKDPKVEEWCKEVGAEGVNLVGLCCTLNEVLMRYGVQPLGNFLAQEFAMATGVLDSYIVDVQCIMPALGDLTKCYHTKVFTTSPKAKMIGATHVDFSEENAYEIALDLLHQTIQNFKERKEDKINIPTQKEKIVAGFSVETIVKALDGVTNSHAHPTGTVKPLCDAITSGVLRGAVAMVGCNNTRIPLDRNDKRIAEILMQNDIIIVGSGCAATTCAKYGMLTYEAKDKCSLGLKTVCELVGIPPMLHMGSCVDISRIVTLVAACAKYLGVDISQLPIAASAPEWMSEKAVTIGTYAVTSGVFVHLGNPPQVSGAPNVASLLTDGIEGIYGGKFYVEPDPEVAAARIIEEIEAKRKAIGI